MYVHSYIPASRFLVTPAESEERASTHYNDKYIRTYVTTEYKSLHHSPLYALTILSLADM